MRAGLWRSWAVVWVAVLVVGMVVPAAVAVPGAADGQQGGAVLALPGVQWLAGTPAATSVQLSELAFPDGTDTVLVARDDAFADALAAGVLQADAPLLLVDGQQPLAGAVREEIDRLGATRAIVLGGTAAVGDVVTADLAARGLDVRRIAGDSRLATARLVATDGDVTAARPDAVILARAFGSGGDETRAFADSLVAGALAADTGWPILLTQTEVLSPDAATAITAIDPDEVLVIGGDAAIAPAAVAALGRPSRRLAGPSRIETARAVQAERQAGRPGDADTAIVLPAGDPEAWVPGFTSAALAGRTGAPVVLGGGGLADPDADAVARAHPSQVVCAPDLLACADAVAAAGLGTATPPAYQPAAGAALAPGGSLEVDLPAGVVGVVRTAGDCLAAPGVVLAPTGRLDLDVADPLPPACDVALTYLSLSGVVTAVATFTGDAAAAPGGTPGLMISGAVDHATHVVGNPWDYADAADHLIMPQFTSDGVGQQVQLNVRDVAVRDGVLSMTGERGYSHLLWQGFDGAMPVAPEGAAVPIDGTRFSEVIIRVRSSAGTDSVLETQTCLQAPGQCTNLQVARLQAGWNTIRLPLGHSGPVYGLRYGPAGSTTTTLDIDWVRVVTPDGPANRAALPGPGPHTLTPGDLQGGDLPTHDGLSPVVQDGQVTAAGVAGGSWTLTDASGTRTVLRVVPPPAVHIRNPDITGGEDYITAATGDPWDFSQPTDAARVGGADQVAFSGGRLTARNTPAPLGDPFVAVRMGVLPLDPNRYHRVTVTYGNDGPMDLGFGPGGGSHGRLIWRRLLDYDDGAELVAYPQVSTYSFSMADPRAVESDGGGNRWLGLPVDLVRFDPNEDPGSRGWFIDELRIAADDESGGPFTVELADLGGAGSGAAPGTVRIALDTDRSGFDGTVVATAAPLAASGPTHVPISTCGVPPGTYWVHVTADRGPASSQTYATGPLQVSNSAC